MSVTTSKIPAAFILITITLGVYLLTLSPTVYLGDSGELSAAAFCLGVPHGSGYPLYVLLGKGFCLLPFGDVGFRMNLMSAVFGVLAVGLVYSLIWRMTGSKVGAWVGGGVLAFIPVFWWQAMAAEVYTLHVFFVALMMLVVVALGGEAGVCVFGGVFVGDGVEFWESPADGDAGAWGVLFDFVWGSEGAFGWEAVFGVVVVFGVASFGVPVLADSDVGWGGDALGGSGQLGSVLGACEWEVSPGRVCF